MWHELRMVLIYVDESTGIDQPQYMGYCTAGDWSWGSGSSAEILREFTDHLPQDRMGVHNQGAIALNVPVP